ncbi:MAG: DUF2784 family protein [Dissulfurispiraceae bacterium]
MFYKVLADIVILFHFIWIVFHFFGAFFGIQNRAKRIVHIFGFFFAFVIEAFDWYYTLTCLETWLKSRYEPTMAYTVAFIIHYIEKIVCIETPRYLIFIATDLLCAFNARAYLRTRKDKAGKERTVVRTVGLDCSLIWAGGKLS